MTDLKSKANPLNGLCAALICEIQELTAEQRITNELLIENGKTLVTISNQKAAQANGDWWSRLFALVALAVAGATLYFSDSPFAQGVRAWLSQWGVK